ncbi:hypothetical protein C5C36_08430 [Rathayibacter sp. AY1G1]|nr:hypothetical protein C5B98_08995 [Rathayibacter sp. AY1A5]PPF19994.1 hypothetical protein C5B95_09125 [Rathayibacter sp. AY1A7]PPF27003.1 hypothetical protein C5C54_11075 [Rathayibacter sp. AY1F2]PPF49628.1 hypothetical protein C5E14_03700 [Rathayibacter sp. AY1A1]PPF73047.1 hypothetical protein C5C46_03805 [Rathayibacter sp. AY1E6]PPG15951.1 hypothetical protein C5C74_12480 [Rathayibacter sp. AY1E8]PPG60733.1 hypothetical protein C5C57_04555 [Rathayibacter sp. AY1C5]PPG99752.1 hypothetic
MGSAGGRNGAVQLSLGARLRRGHREAAHRADRVRADDRDRSHTPGAPEGCGDGDGPLRSAVVVRSAGVPRARALARRRSSTPSPRECDPLVTTVDPGALDHAVWARSDQLAFVEDDAQAVLLNLLSPFPVPLVLKGTAHAIWRRLEHPSTTVEILAGLADEFGVPREVLEEDVLSFLLELSTADVVHRLPSR